MNPRIAPPVELDVDDRIAEIEKWLEDQEAKAGVTPKPKVAPKSLSQTPFEGTYKSQTGLFKGTTSGQVAMPPPLTGEEVVELLKKISENQELERLRYERNNAVSGDDPIYDWAESEVPPGFMVQFIYNVPEGHVFFLEYINIVHNIDTTYSVWIDGQYQPNISFAIEDFGDHNSIWNPKKMCYNNVQVWALNNWVANQTYATFFRGFNRFYRSIHREITYESLEKEKQET